MATAHHNTPLVVRASLPRTFWSLGLFVAAGLAFFGTYLLIEEVKSPLEANQESVICAGVLLSLATILLFYLVGPKRFVALAKVDDRQGEEKLSGIPLTAFGESVQARRRAEEEMEKDELPGPM